MNRYDAFKAPDPEAWLALDEGLRVALVEDYHKRTEGRFPRLRVHSIFHNIVESQLAMGLPEVGAALKRLMAEGLDPHQAVHAIASVMAGQIHGMLSKRQQFEQEAYDRALKELTAAKWWALAEPNEPPGPASRPGRKRR